MPDTPRPSHPAGRARRPRRLLAAAGTACLLGTTTVALQASAAHAAGTAYYVDCSAQANGNGTSASPWNALSSVNSHTFGAADQILLRAGTTCGGYLQASGSGASGSPITVDRYGTGAAPQINTAGAAEAAVILRNVSYWTVQNLAVTNNPSASGKYSGVLADATDNGTYSGITINAMDVSGVNGGAIYDTPYRYSSAGILARNPDRGTGLTGHFAGLTIANNTVRDVRSMGIAVVGGNGKDSAARNTGVWIHGNTVTRPANDGILVGVSTSPLTEHNISHEAGWNNPNQGPIAAIWAYTSSDPLFQYNEAVSTQPSGDSMAWDCDWGVSGTCTYQYNYSNGNAGGFFMNCLKCFGGNDGVTMVVRGNVSQNEGQIVKDASSSERNTLLMYNNTFDSPNQALSIGTPYTAAVKNNIFIGNGLTIWPPAQPDPPTPPMPTNIAIDNNLWWGGLSAPSSDAHAIAKDPLLVEDSAGGYGTGTTAGATMGATGGFQLAVGSPALASGAVIASNGGRDLWGNPVSATAAPNVGAYNGPAQQQQWKPFNDNSQQFSYDSSWGSQGGRGFGDYQNDVHYTRTNNGSVTFTFHGTGVKVLTETNSDEGTVNYSLDGGARQGSYDAAISSPARRVQVPVLTLTGLEPGTAHTLTLTKASGTFMVIDRIDVLPASYNDNATSQLTYTSFNNNGSWGSQGGRGFGDHQNDVHYTRTNNDSVTFTFTGTGVKVLTETYSDEGTVNYNLDSGAQQGSYNATSTTRQAQVPVLILSGLANTSHTLTLTKTSGTFMVIDRFDVTG
jgi:hypothetical protein